MGALLNGIVRQANDDLPTTTVSLIARIAFCRFFYFFMTSDRSSGIQALTRQRLRSQGHPAFGSYFDDFNY
jgi:hypothetical protein